MANENIAFTEYAINGQDRENRIGKAICAVCLLAAPVIVAGAFALSVFHAGNEHNPNAATKMLQPLQTQRANASDLTTPKP